MNAKTTAQTPAEIRWARLSNLFHNEWMLTDPATDDRTEEQYAMDAEHELALSVSPVPVNTTPAAPSLDAAIQAGLTATARRSRKPVPARRNVVKPTPARRVVKPNPAALLHAMATPAPVVPANGTPVTVDDGTDGMVVGSEITRDGRTVVGVKDRYDVTRWSNLSEVHPVKSGAAERSAAALWTTPDALRTAHGLSTSGDAFLRTMWALEVTPVAPTLTREDLEMLAANAEYDAQTAYINRLAQF